MKEVKKVKILVIDDEPGVLKVIKEIIQGPDHDITTETSPFRASELIKQEEFDIYIIDSYLQSNMDGIDLCEIIQIECSGRKYVSLFCTAVGTKHIFKEEFDNNLFDFFIEKPFEIGVFKKTFTEALTKLEQIRSK